MANILAICGSSRANGNTAQLTDRVLEGIPSRKIVLAELHIQPIVDERHDPSGFHQVADDYDRVVEQMMQHDVLLFATPVYWYGMSGHMKNFVDRWSQSLRDPRFPFRQSMAGKTAFVITVGGDNPRIKALPLIQQFQYIFDFMPMSFGGYVIGDANQPGEILADAQAMAEAGLLREQLLRLP